MITKLNQVVEAALAQGRKRLAVAYGQDSHTIEAVYDAYKEGLVEPTIYGDKAVIEKTCAELGVDVNAFRIIDEKSDVNCVRLAVASVAAGITLNDLAHYLVPDYDEYERERWIAEAEERLPEFPDTFHEPIVFRVVPNTAVEVLSGVTFIAQQGASDEQVTYVSQLFEALGFAMVVEEKLIPAGTSLASCGIAFAMRYIRAAMEGGVELGFRPAEAARIVEHTVKGAAALLLSHGAHPEAEIDKVTTAGGITIKGLNAMEKAGFTAAVIDGLKASM